MSFNQGTVRRCRIGWVAFLFALGSWEFWMKSSSKKPLFSAIEREKYRFSTLNSGRCRCPSFVSCFRRSLIPASLSDVLLYHQCPNTHVSKPPVRFHSPVFSCWSDLRTFPSVSCLPLILRFVYQIYDTVSVYSLVFPALIVC